MTEVTYRLATPPSTNHLFINVARGRAPSQEYTTWKRGETKSLMSQRARPIVGPVLLSYRIEDNKRRDIGNYEKQLTDLLVSCGVIDGDGWKTVKGIELKWAPIKGVEVTITPLSEARA